MLALDNNIPGQAFTSMTIEALNQSCLNYKQPLISMRGEQTTPV